MQVTGAFLFKERLGVTKVLLFLTALFGLILATGIKWNMIDTGSLLGVGFTLLAAILYAGVVLVGKGLKSVKPEFLTFVQCAVGVLLCQLLIHRFCTLRSSFGNGGGCPDSASFIPRSPTH
jgi:drug/metabolite transporter (DMT)-like permease